VEYTEAEIKETVDVLMPLAEHFENNSVTHIHNHINLDNLTSSRVI